MVGFWIGLGKPFIPILLKINLFNTGKQGHILAVRGCTWHLNRCKSGFIIAGYWLVSEILCIPNQLIYIDLSVLSIENE